jgi:hypothetical protein
VTKQVDQEMVEDFEDYSSSNKSHNFRKFNPGSTYKVDE